MRAIGAHFFTFVVAFIGTVICLYNAVKWSKGASPTLTAFIWTGTWSIIGLAVLTCLISVIVSIQRWWHGVPVRDSERERARMGPYSFLGYWLPVPSIRLSFSMGLAMVFWDGDPWLKYSGRNVGTFLSDWATFTGVMGTLGIATMALKDWAKALFDVDWPTAESGIEPQGAVATDMKSDLGAGEGDGDST